MNILFDRIKSFFFSSKMRLILPLVIIFIISITTILFSNYLLALNQKQTSQTKAQSATVTGTPSTIDSSSLPYVSQDYDPTTDLKNPGASSGGVSTPKTCSFGGNGSGGCGKATKDQWGLRNPDGTAYTGDPKNCSNCSTGIIKNNKTDTYAKGVYSSDNKSAWAAAKAQSAATDIRLNRAETRSGGGNNSVKNGGSSNSGGHSLGSGASSSGGESRPGTCFITGTKITMADGTEKNIENITVGEKVKSYNEKTEKIENKLVLETVSDTHNKMVKLTFSDNTTNTNTINHRYLVKNKGWISYINKLKRGDIVYKNVNNKLVEVSIVSIEEQLGNITTYNLDSIEDNHTFFANDILVHNKKVEFIENNDSSSSTFLIASGKEYVYKKSDFYIDSVSASISAFLTNTSLTQTNKSFILGNPKNNDDYIYRCYILKDKNNLKCNNYSDLLILSDNDYFCCPK